jgi:hypothetical protein
MPSLLPGKLLYHCFRLLPSLSSWQDDHWSNDSMLQLFCWLLFWRFSGTVHCMCGWLLFWGFCWNLFCEPSWNFLDFSSYHLSCLHKLPSRKIFISGAECMLFLPNWTIHRSSQLSRLLRREILQYFWNNFLLPLHPWKVRTIYWEHVLSRLSSFNFFFIRQHILWLS